MQAITLGKGFFREIHADMFAGAPLLNAVLDLEENLWVSSKVLYKGLPFQYEYKCKGIQHDRIKEVRKDDPRCQSILEPHSFSVWKSSLVQLFGPIGSNWDQDIRIFPKTQTNQTEPMQTGYSRLVLSVYGYITSFNQSQL